MYVYIGTCINTRHDKYNRRITRQEYLAFFMKIHSFFGIHLDLFVEILTKGKICGNLFTEIVNVGFLWAYKLL